MNTKTFTIQKDIFYAALITLAFILLFLFLHGRSHVPPVVALHANATKVTRRRVHAAPTGLHELNLPTSDAAVESLNSINLRRFGLHKYLVNFAGLATYQGKPCANASILVRISTVDSSQAVGIITQPDGTYTTQILVEAMPNQPIDWIVEGYTPEFKKVEIVGRKIGTNEDNTIGVQQEVAFLNKNDVAGLPASLKD